MNNLNIDPSKLNEIKNMMGDKNFNDAISQISPEMIENFSKMMNNSNENKNENGKQNNNQAGNVNNSSSSNNQGDGGINLGNLGNLDFSNLDMNTIMKFKSMFDNSGGGNDSSKSNLLYSLKPYLRDEKKGKVDQYANLLNLANMANLANLFNPSQGGNKKNE